MRSWVLGLGVAGLSLWAWISHFSPDTGLEVETVRVCRGPVEETVSATRAGTLKSVVQVVLGAQAAGRVLALEHRERERIAKGEPICRLDAAGWEARLRQAEQTLVAAEAERDGRDSTLKDADRQARRQRRLLEQRAVSEEEMERIDTKAELERSGQAFARARAEEARAAVAVARTELEKTVVSAPFDGLVTDTFVECGQWVVPGTPVCEFMDDSALHVEAEFDEVDSARLVPGQGVRLSVDALPGERFEGRLSAISPSVSVEQEKNRTVEVEVAWTGDRARVRPGMSVDVEIVVGRREDALFLPSPSVLERGGRRVVFVAEGGCARLREVRTGLANWETVEILSGLSEGEEVIRSLGVPGLRDGARVTPSVRP